MEVVIDEGARKNKDRNNVFTKYARNGILFQLWINYEENYLDWLFIERFTGMS